MSRRVGGGRGKAKKDDLAKAAAEVLNNINVAPAPALVSPTNSGGLLRGALEDRDRGADVQPKQQLLVSPGQEPPPPVPPPPAAAPAQQVEALTTSRRDPPATAQMRNPGIDSGGTRTLGGFGGSGSPGAGGSGSPGVGGSGSPGAVANADGRGGSGGLGNDPATPDPVPNIDSTPPPKPPGPTFAIAAKAATTVARVRGIVARALGRRTPAAAAVPFRLDHDDHDDDAAAAPFRAAGGAVTVATPLAAAALLLLLSLLMLSAAGFRHASTAVAAQGPLAEAVGELRRQLADSRQAAAAAAAELREALRGFRLQDQRLGQQLAELDEGLATALIVVQNQAAEIRALQQALAARDAVLRIATDSGGEDDDGHGGDNEREGSGAAVERAVTSVTVKTVIGVDGGGGARGLDLRALPACHVRRMEAAAGPLLPARVSGHSTVAGAEGPMTLLYSALSAVFAPTRGGARIHPLARHVTNPAAALMCLPLASSGGGGAGTEPFLELTLAAPANVSAISFRYPAYGTWDTSTALSRLSATLHEAPAGGAGGAAADVGTRKELHARRVELPPLRGIECQHVALPPAPLPGPYDKFDGPMLVYGITLHVHGNFGHREQTCMPRVLVHGWVV